MPGGAGVADETVPGEHSQGGVREAGAAGRRLLVVLRGEVFSGARKQGGWELNGEETIAAPRDTTHIMRLTALEPQFLVAFPQAGGGYSLRHVDTLAAAMGLWFLCPRCFENNRGPVGTHMIACWSKERGAPDDVFPVPGRWRIEGTGFHDLTLNAEPPEVRRSVHLTGEGCGAHFTIQNGEVTAC